MNNKNKKIVRILIVLTLIFTIIGGTFAYWNWKSNVDKEIIFNTSKGLEEYIIYDSGESKFVGDFGIGTSYLDGVHTTISIYKTEEALNASLYASINMRINEIGNKMRTLPGLKWTITLGSSTDNGSVLASGNFLDLDNDDEILLLPYIEVTDEITEYTIWIWLDENESTSYEMSGETIDTSIWTQVDQIVDDIFEITRLNNDYQVINATVVNSKNKIVSYAITNDSVEPVLNNFDNVTLSPLVSKEEVKVSKIDNETQWIDIPVEEQNKVYNFEYTVSEVGTYYIWFKDSSGEVIGNSINVSEIKTDIPLCTWGEFSDSTLGFNQESTIELTCIDTENSFSDSEITLNDITLTSNVISIDNIVKERIVNGYKYIFTLIGNDSEGNTTLTLKENSVSNIYNKGNNETISKKITVGSIYSITYKDVGNTEFSGIHESGYPTEYMSGSDTILDIPTKNGYTFLGYFLDSDGNNQIYKIDNTYSEDITIYAKWKDKPPYGTASLSLLDGVFTLTLSDYGDEGSGLINTYGYALISSGSCSDATYTNSAELSMTYSENLVNNMTYYGCIKLTDNSGSISYIKSNEVEYVYVSGVQTYTSVGEHEFVVPATGTYKLEVWGAEGATSGGIGGYGGYSIGIINLEKNKKIFINIGGIGNVMTGGYNGGGNGSSLYSTGGAYKNGGGGGGATHIAKVQGKLSTLEGYKGVLRDDGLSYNSSDILIVAGGGGGGAYIISGNYNGGSGGGISGINGTGRSVNPVAGTQITGYLFGLGQNGLPGDGSSWGESGRGGGGGGFYGGNASQTSTNGIAGGGGGSGYIGSSLLTDKYMYCYNCTTSDNEHTKTYTTTDVSSTPIANYAKSGNGAARIAYDIVENVSSLMLTYNNNGGSGCYSKSIVTGGVYGELCIPTRVGYKFDGWYTESNGGERITSDTEVTVTENQTLYAHWLQAINPNILFNSYGNKQYVSGDISNIINVYKGENDLDTSTFKYIWSEDISIEPNISFVSGEEVVLEDASGIYYLIARVCDVLGNCVKKISEPFYVDNTNPEGTISLIPNGGAINVQTNISDIHSGINTYGYLLVSDGEECPESGYYTTNNTNYSLFINQVGINKVCVKAIDNAGNYTIVSDSIEVNKASYTYEQLATNYSCANSSSGSNPFFTYTGNCQLINDGNNNWRVKFTSNGTLTVKNPFDVDLFLVGGGAGNGGYGGANYLKEDLELSNGTSYTIYIGGGSTSSGTATSFSSYSAAGGTSSSGGATEGTCEFRALNSSGGCLYGASYGHKNASNGTHGQCWDGWADWGNGAWTTCCTANPSSGSANTGNNGGSSTYYCTSAGSGGSGIAIIRNSQ